MEGTTEDRALGTQFGSDFVHLDEFKHRKKRNIYFALVELFIYYDYVFYPLNHPSSDVV